MATNKNFIVKNGLEVGGTATMDGLTVDGNASTTGVLTLGNAGITNAFINSADSLYINIDSNNDQAGGNDFQIGRNSTGTSSQKIFLAGENGDISFYEDTGTTPKLFWDASSESLSIGTNGSTTDRRFQVSGTAASTAATQFGIVANPTYPTNVTGDVYNLYSQPNVASGTTLTSLYNLYLGATGLSGSTITNLYGVYQAGASEKNYFAGNVGIGTSSPSAGIPLTAYYSPTSQMHLGGAGNIVSNNTYFNGTAWVNRNSAVGGAVLQINNDGAFYFRRAGTGASPTLNYSALIDSSGNVLVGKTVNDLTTDGIVLRGSGELFVTRANDVAAFNRRSSDGQIVTIRRDGASVGAIGGQGGTLYITGPEAGGLKFSYYDLNRAAIFPVTTTGAIADNLHDMGYAGSRFDNIWATNGTIETSDRNEKQDIEELSAAETAVAVACKRLLRKFRWIDAVEKKGDDARIHFGIIAQDLQAAFEAEGLDAGRYAMFTSNTWWETQTEVEAVEAVEFVQDVEAVYDEDGELVSEAVEGVEAVEAKDAYTRTDTFDTLADAPEGATERTRLGVRYSELLAFIIAAI